MTSSEGSPTRPRAFGDELRRLREAAGVELEQISGETKVSRRQLEALESGMFHLLPEKVFARNFVRQYLHLVGADEAAMIAAFDAAWDRFQLASGSHPVVRIDEVPPQRPVRWGFWIPVGLGAAILLVVGVVIVSSGLRTTEALPDPMRAPAVRPSPTSPTSAMEVAVAPSPFLPLELHTGAQPAATSFTVAVDADGECWIHFRDQSGRTDQRLLAGGSRTTLVLEGPVLLTVGNAGAVRIEVAGRSYDQLGAAGQVVHVEVGPDGLSRLDTGETRG